MVPVEQGTIVSLGFLQSVKAANNIRNLKLKKKKMQIENKCSTSKTFCSLHHDIIHHVFTFLMDGIAYASGC